MQTILVCDDDKQIVEAIDIYLTGEGFQVIKAYDGYEALELLENNSVDLMIVDVMMPGLDGIRTTLKVRETSSIPIIIGIVRHRRTSCHLIGISQIVAQAFCVSDHLIQCVDYRAAGAECNADHVGLVVDLPVFFQKVFVADIFEDIFHV